MLYRQPNFNPSQPRSKKSRFYDWKIFKLYDYNIIAPPWWGGAMRACRVIPDLTSDHSEEREKKKPEDNKWDGEKSHHVKTTQ